MPERILVVSPRYWPENYKINDICAGFAERGYRVDVISGQPNFPAGQFFDGYSSYGHNEEKHGKVRILRHFEPKRGSGSGFGIMLNYIVSSFAASRSLRRIRKRKYSSVLIYQTSPVMACTAGLKAARKKKIPAVIYAVDIWPDSLYRELDMQSPILRRIFRSISNRKYLAADEIVTQSRAAEQYFVRELSIHPGRVRCIPPGPDGNIISDKDDRELLERYYGGFNILVFDEMLDKQDYDTLLESAVLIRDTGLIDIRMIIVCSADASPLKKKISRQGLGDIVFVENRKAAPVAGYYRIADAFLSCEKTSAGDEYSFPGDIINYISMAKPVIFAGDGDGRRIVREAGCGKICDPEDPGSLYGIIMEMYRAGRAERERMGQAALRYQQENYSTDACVDALLEVLFRNVEGSDDEYIINTGTNVIKADDLFEEEDENE